MQCTHSIYLNNWINLFQRRVDYNHPGPKLVFGWQYDVSGEEIGHIMSVRNPETSLDSGDAQALQLRVACHYLVDLVSDEGLPELFDCLKDNLEFYKTRESDGSTRLVSSSGVHAKLGQKYDRPAFQLAEE